MPIIIDNAVPFTAFASCQRPSKPSSYRKFKSLCGSYILVGSKERKVISVEVDRVQRQCILDGKNCQSCKNAIDLAKKVIERGD